MDPTRACSGSIVGRKNGLCIFRDFLTQSDTKEDLKLYVVTSMAKNPSVRLDSHDVCNFYKLKTVLCVETSTFCKKKKKKRVA